MIKKQKIGVRIQQMIDCSELTQRELARQIHVTPNTINGYVSGRRLPDVDKLYLIAEHLDCSIDYLIGISDSPKISGSLTTVSEHHLIENYRKLNPLYRKILEELSSTLMGCQNLLENSSK